MEKKRIICLKKVRYICMVFVIALGLITFNGCGGGSGGGGNDDPVADTVAPEDVISLSAEPGDSKATLSWVANDSTEGDLAGYKIYYSSDDGATYTLAESELGASVITFEVTGLTNGTCYKFKVISYDEIPNESSGATVLCYANAPLSESDMPIQNGLINNGITRAATQKITGIVPNPAGLLTESYEGKAYLVLNGDKIPLDVTNSGGSTNSATGRMIYKEGKEYYLENADVIDLSAISKGKANGSDIAWVFEVTFSVNAGQNTFSIEVYDINDTLFARTDQWDIIGAIEPAGLVVTLWWNTDKTDIDLHVSHDDGATHCYYGNDEAGNMVLDYDDVNGYGPEHITVDSVTGTKTYKIKVYYYADHNEAEETTATTANITAAVNGETKLEASHLMTFENTSSSWGSGSHIWDAGELEVSGANRYDVILNNPDLSDFPQVELTVIVTDPGNDDEYVQGLTSDNFYVVNAGTSMLPVTITENSSSYTLTYTDITCGARDLYVYVNVPAEDDTPIKGGLSNTKTYGSNYAIMVGLNEYPAAMVSTANVRWYDEDNSPRIDVTVDMKPDGKNDFTATFTDDSGVRVPVSPNVSSMEDLGGNSYKLVFSTPDNYLEYDNVSLTYKKQCWLSNSINDITDLRAALMSKARLMTSSLWLDENIHILTDSSATESAITSQISTIAGNMEKYDLFLFHFSGHGSGNPDAVDGSQYLCAYEDANWISVTDLSNAIKEIPVPGADSYITNVFVLLDACHSGNFIGKGIERGFGVELDRTKVSKFRPFIAQYDENFTDDYSKKFSRDLQNMSNKNHVFVMTAVTGNKSAWDDGELKNGVFTYYLVEGITVVDKYISAGAANANNDTWITAEEAFNYLDSRANAWVSTDNGYPADAVQDAQLQDNSTTTSSRLIYNW